MGIGCDGMIDINKIKAKAEGIADIKEESDKIVADTLYDGEIAFDKSEILLKDARPASRKSTSQ